MTKTKDKRHKIRTCKECDAEFGLSVSEQEFYASRGLDEPKRCEHCRVARRLVKGVGDQRPPFGNREYRSAR